MLPYGKILQKKKSSCNLEQAERNSKKREKNIIFETASSEINGLL
jgi:hypothetical protein